MNVEHSGCLAAGSDENFHVIRDSIFRLLPVAFHLSLPCLFNELVTVEWAHACRLWVQSFTRGAACALRVTRQCLAYHFCWARGWVKFGGRTFTSEMSKCFEPQNCPRSSRHANSASVTGLRTLRHDRVFCTKPSSLSYHGRPHWHIHTQNTLRVFIDRRPVRTAPLLPRPLD